MLPRRLSENGEGLALDGGSPSRGGENLSRCRTQVDTRQFRHLWEIEQMSVHMEMSEVGDSISSVKFGDAEYEFLLKLFPAGKDEESAGYLSLFLQILKCPKPKLQFRVNFSLETLDGPRGCALNRNVVTINKGGIVTASKFYSLETLKARSRRLFPDDLLTISAMLTVYGDTLSLPEGDELDDDVVDIHLRHLMDPYDFDAEASMNEMEQGGKRRMKPIVQEKQGEREKAASYAPFLATGEFSDFEIKTEDGRTFAVHKLVLAGNSEFFRAMLRPNHREYEENKVELKDMDSDILDRVLKYIYTKTCPGVEEHALEIIYAADRLMVDGLKALCSSVLMRDLSVANICSRLELADNVNDAKLFRKAVSFFAQNKTEITASNDWNRMRESRPALLAKVVELAWELSQSTRFMKRRKVEPEE